MKTASKSILLLLVLLLLLSSCAKMPLQGVPRQREDGGLYNVEWYSITPPRPGLRCWVAQWSYYAVSYCEPADNQ